MKNVLIVSTSTVHGQPYLSYMTDEINTFFNGVDEIIFVPYARPGGVSHDEYTEKVSGFFNQINIRVKGLHTFDDPKEAIQQAKGIFIGGGNTFVLIDQLYKLDLVPLITEVVNNGTPYMGTSAGCNLCGLTVQNTNDMPIIYPKSFRSFGFVPFNLNPHYLDPVEGSTHMGETRETRIKEFHAFNNIPVVGLREGSWLYVKGSQVILKGGLTARIFEKDKIPYELADGKEINFKTDNHL
jgi:dipeptidase E